MGLSTGRRRLLSLLIGGVGLGLAAAPALWPRRVLAVAVGSELEPAMAELERLFERRNPAVDLRWEVQGSQDMVERALEPSADRARVLIPANREHLLSLDQRLRRQGAESLLEPPRPIARTLLVAVAWPERAERLFAGAGEGGFRWPPLERALRQGRWDALGGRVTGAGSCCRPPTRSAPTAASSPWPCGRGPTAGLRKGRRCRSGSAPSISRPAPPTSSCGSSSPPARTTATWPSSTRAMP
ncbi:hypothetical protein EVJ50_01140 [Synechococcus sp. RSCCF101]|nr:hypothetical protein EVJ50_01140 [Synechococcus sp. RSCCF101]